QGCDYYYGYHQESPNLHLAYSITERCGSDELAKLTKIISYDLVELATDPLSRSNPAWQITQGLSAYSETGDLCWPLSVNAPLTVDTPDGGELLTAELARYYSAQGAASGHSDTCVPSMAVPFFGVAYGPTPVVELGPSHHATITL